MKILTLIVTLLLIPLFANAQTAKEYYEKGNIKYQNRDYEGAMESFNSAIELNPNYSEAYIERARTKVFGLDDYKSAISDLNKAIKLDPKNSSSYSLRATIKELQIGDFEGALNDLSKAIGVDPENPDLYAERGILREIMSDHIGALEDYNKVIEFDSKDSDSYSYRGSLKESIGDYNGAIEDYNKALELDSEHAEAHRGRANVKTALNDYQGAIQDYDKSIEIWPEYTISYIERGVVKYKLGDYESAIQDFTKAVELSPKNYTAFLHRGTTKFKSGYYLGTVHDFSKATLLKIIDLFETTLFMIKYSWDYGIWSELLDNILRGVGQFVFLIILPLVLLILLLFYIVKLPFKLIGSSTSTSAVYNNSSTETKTARRTMTWDKDFKEEINLDNIPIHKFYNFYGITESGHQLGPLTSYELVKKLGFINKNLSTFSSLGNSIQMMWNEHKGNKFLANKDLIIYNKYLPDNYINKVQGDYKGQKKIWLIQDFISKKETKEYLFPHLQRVEESEEQWLHRCESRLWYLNTKDRERGDFYFKKFISEFGSEKYENYKKEQKELARKKEKKAMERLEKRNYWKRQRGDKLELAVSRLLEKAYPDSEIKLTKQSYDGGVDIYVKHSNNNLWAIQCKGHKKPIGRPDCQQIVGAALLHEAKAIMISTSGYSSEAKRYSNSKQFDLELWTIQDLINIAEDINYKI